MKRLTLKEAQEELGKRDLWLWRQEHWGAPFDGMGASVVGDHDEDYVVDALFDIPNR